MSLSHGGCYQAHSSITITPTHHHHEVALLKRHITCKTDITIHSNYLWHLLSSCLSLYKLLLGLLKSPKGHSHWMAKVNTELCLLPLFCRSFSVILDQTSFFALLPSHKNRDTKLHYKDIWCKNYSCQPHKKPVLQQNRIRLFRNHSLHTWLTKNLFKKLVFLDKPR